MTRGVVTDLRSANSPENIAVSVTAESFFAFFGLDATNLPTVTVDKALKVPAVTAAVAFLSRTLAALPLHAYRRTKDGPQKIEGKLGTIIHENPNSEMGSFKFRQYLWQQVFTNGRGLAWIERNATGIENIWPINPAKVTIRRKGLKLVYTHDGQDYPAADVIDIPFMLKADMTGHYGPIYLASKAIQLALAMNDYASTFFAGGGVPPLALTGPLPKGRDAMQRAVDDVGRAIDAAKTSGKPIFQIPPDHKLEPVGIDPQKGQMIDARLFQIQEIARAWQLPPVFLQDLSKGTFTNTEQQDLHLVKHVIGQWAQAFEDEANLKLFGRANSNRYVEHNLDGLQRGDFKSRIEGIARAIQTAQMTPNEARALENRPRHTNPAASELLVQGATVVLGSASTPSKAEPPADNGETDDGTSGDAGNA
ncbi:MAG: phage portal protein [Rhizobiales bacterium]|nr:phage portal protein [Hyphomicrobiales bacterium]